MASTVKSFWPSDIQLDARSPLSILEEQADLLAVQTGGAIIGRVTTVKGKELTMYRLDVYAPEIDESRRILTAIYKNDLYPLVMDWDGQRFTKEVITRKDPYAEMLGMGRTIETVSVTEVGEYGTWPRPNESRPIASNQEEFLAELNNRMGSPAVKGLFDSLSVAINMKRKSANASTTSDLAVGSA